MNPGQLFGIFLIIYGVYFFFWSLPNKDRKEEIKYLNQDFLVKQLKYFYKEKSSKEIIDQYLHDLLRLKIIKTISDESLNYVYMYTDEKIEENSNAIFTEWINRSDLWLPKFNRYKKIKPYIKYLKPDYNLRFLPPNFNYQKHAVGLYEKGHAFYLDRVKDQKKIKDLIKKNSLNIAKDE